MKRILVTILGVMGIFLTWGIGIPLIFSFANEPTFVPDDPAWLRLWWEVAPFILTAILTIIVARLLRAELPWHRRAPRSFVFGIAVGTLWIGTAMGVLLALGAISLTGPTPVAGASIYLASIALNAAMQELLVHGLLWVFIASRHGKRAALIATTIVFTAMHPGAFEAGWIAVANVVLAGLLFGYLTGWRGGLPAAIGAHISWNVIGGFILGAVILGDDNSWYSTLSNHGVLGGAQGQGIEGGLVVLVTTLTMLLLVTVFPRTRSHPTN